MILFADLHLHSKYSRATSANSDLEHFVQGALFKGLSLLGTGDFTHPKWFQELKEKLEEKENGLHVLKKGDAGILFMLSTEVSTIISTPKGVKKVHHIIHVPSFEDAEKINDAYSRLGSLEADGRPTFGNCSPAQLVEVTREASENAVIVPAHCLLPEEVILTEGGAMKINELQKDDLVFTHKGRARKVTKVLNRDYSGELVSVIPFYFNEGTTVTPEHPFYAVKTVKNCSGSRSGVCRPVSTHLRFCSRTYYLQYQRAWIMAKDLQVGDAIAYPRFSITEDVESIRITDYVGGKPSSQLNPGGTRGISIKNELIVDKEFCRLIGYYLAEGYTGGGDTVAFTFHIDEQDYAQDVINLMHKIFGLKTGKSNTHKGTKELTLNFYSKVLCKFFNNFIYPTGSACRAFNKRLPIWMLKISKEKQAELLRGWWRGDGGYTSSRELANQMKIICLRLGIIPSIRADTVVAFEKRGKHNLGSRGISASSTSWCFGNLSFFEDHFDLLRDSCFRKFITSRETRHGWMDDDYVYLPVRKLVKKQYSGKVFNLEVEEDNSYTTEFSTVHNCWTPWFAIFGSRSGFNSVEECYEEQAKHIFALETGLSSDPAMNWRLSQLDNFSLMSNSDSHSPNPERIGRECNVFDLKKPSFQEIFDAVKKKDAKRFLYTVETNPAYGKYHWTGHRECNVSLSPKDARKMHDVCPVCRRKLTVGVEERVEELADRQEGFTPEGVIPFKHLLSLSEVIAEVLGKNLYSPAVVEAAGKLVEKFGNEFHVLLNAPKEEMAALAGERIAEGVMRLREERVSYVPGYDGVYGKIRIFEEEEKEVKTDKKQKMLEEFF